MKFFTSDLHIGHKNIIKYCDRPFLTQDGFPDADAMRAQLVKNFCEVIKPGDELYFLGDLAFDVNTTRDFLNAVPGVKFMVWGNHDPHRKERKGLEGAFVKTADLMEVKLMDGVKATLCHYPMLRWNSSHFGTYHLHGHTHAQLRYPAPARILDVGVDNAWSIGSLMARGEDTRTYQRQYYPVPENKIIKYMALQPIPPHHYHEAQ